MDPLDGQETFEVENIVLHPKFSEYYNFLICLSLFLSFFLSLYSLLFLSLSISLFMSFCIS